MKIAPLKRSPKEELSITLGDKMSRTIVTTVIVLLWAVGIVAGEDRAVSSPVLPSLSATVQFQGPSGHNTLDAGEEGKLVLTVTNNAQGDASDVTGEISEADETPELTFAREVAFGTIAGGASMTKVIPVCAGVDIDTADVLFNIHVKAANGLEAPPLIAGFRVKAFEPPDLVVSAISIYDQDGNARMEPMETAELTVRIRNRGQGDAYGVTANIRPGANVFITGDGNTYFELGKIPAGRYHDLKFLFFTNNHIKNGAKIPIIITLDEERSRLNTSESLNLFMNTPLRKSEDMLVGNPGDRGKRGETF
jgi:hypothetical protein